MKKDISGKGGKKDLILIEKNTNDKSIGKEISLITVGMSIVTAFFIIILWPVLDNAAIAASSIFL